MGSLGSAFAGPNGPLGAIGLTRADAVSVLTCLSGGHSDETRFTPDVSVICVHHLTADFQRKCGERTKIVNQ